MGQDSQKYPSTINFLKNEDFGILEGYFASLQNNPFVSTKNTNELRIPWNDSSVWL